MSNVESLMSNVESLMSNVESRMLKVYGVECMVYRRRIQLRWFLFL